MAVHSSIVLPLRRWTSCGRIVEFSQRSLMRSVSIISVLIVVAAISIKAQNPPGDAGLSKIEILRHYAELGRSGQYDKQAEFWSNDAVNNGRPMRPEFIRIILQDVYRTFPDYRSEVVETVEFGN